MAPRKQRTSAVARDAKKSAAPPPAPSVPFGTVEEQFIVPEDMKKIMFRRKDSASRSIQRGVPFPVTDPVLNKRRSADYAEPQRDYRTERPNKHVAPKQVAPKLSLKEMRPPLRQSNSLRSLDSDEWDSTDDDGGSVKSLITPEERARRNRRLRSLEKRSRKRNNDISSMEASTMDLPTLIANEEWKHVMRKIGRDPRSMSVKYDIELNGQRTKAYPLHHAASHRPPVNVIDAMVAVFPEACRIPDEAFGMLPLHIACKFCASGDILKLIMDFFPDAVRLTDTVERRLPLHYACNDGYPNDVSMLIAAEKRALMAKDIHGKTPVDICQESTSPHRDAILKRIYVISKYDGPAARSRRSRERGPRAPTTPAYEEQSEYPVESPSEVTVETSNVTNKLKPKNILPAFARGRKAKSDVPSIPENIEAVVPPESPRQQQEQVPQHVKKRGSSLERLKPRRRKTYDKYGDSKSLPSKPVRHENRSLETQSSFPPRVVESKKPSPETSSTRSSNSQKRRSRNQDDSVPTATPSYATNRETAAFVPVKPKSPRVMRSSVPFDESANHAESQSDFDAPEVTRRKKKGLSSNSDLLKLLEQEEKQASMQELGHDSRLLSLPFGNSPQKQSNPNNCNSPRQKPRQHLPRPQPISPGKRPILIDPSSSRQRLDGQRNLSSVRQNSARMSTGLNEADRGHHSMPITPTQQSKRMAASPSQIEPGHHSMPVMASSPSMQSPHCRNHRPIGIMSPCPQYSNAENGGTICNETEMKKHHLKLRKAALVEECNHVSETIMKKREKAHMSQTKISLVESQIRELEHVLERERKALDVTLSGIGLHEEILLEHEGKIQVVNDELRALEMGRSSSSHSMNSRESESVATSGAVGSSSSSESDDSSTSSGSSDSSSSSGDSSSGSSSSSDSSSGTGTSSSKASSAAATLSFS